MSRMLLLLVALLIASTLHSQSWDDLAAYKHIELDREMQGEHKMIFVSPPAGTYWVITGASFATERPVPGGGILVWTETAPYAPFRDPVTKEMKGCASCVTLIRVSAEHSFVPIVGGYSDRLQGQTMPIIVRAPNRLAIALNGLKPEETLKTFARFTVIERPIVTAPAAVLTPFGWQGAR